MFSETQNAVLEKKMPNELPQSANQQFYTVYQTAEVLQISRNGLYRLIRAGTIKAVWIGGLKRVPASELDRLTNSGIR